MRVFETSVAFAKPEVIQTIISRALAARLCHMATGIAADHHFEPPVLSLKTGGGLAEVGRPLFVPCQRQNMLVIVLGSGELTLTGDVTLTKHSSVALAVQSAQADNTGWQLVQSLLVDPQEDGFSELSDEKLYPPYLPQEARLLLAIDRHRMLTGAKLQ